MASCCHAPLCWPVIVALYWERHCSVGRPNGLCIHSPPMDPCVVSRSRILGANPLQTFTPSSGPDGSPHLSLSLSRHRGGLAGSARQPGFCWAPRGAPLWGPAVQLSARRVPPSPQPTGERCVYSACALGLGGSSPAAERGADSGRAANHDPLFQWFPHRQMCSTESQRCSCCRGQPRRRRKCPL